MNIHNKGYSLLETTVAIAIFSITLNLATPLVKNFYTFLAFTNNKSGIKNYFRILDAIENQISSTSIEISNPPLNNNLNLGFSVLQTKNIYLSGLSSKSLTPYFIPQGSVGDSLYIEIPDLDFDSNSISFNYYNEFHLYRFVLKNSITGKQSFNYIRGDSRGGRYLPLKFTKEETLLENVYNGYFQVIKGGVIVEFTLEPNIKISKKILRTGEL